MKKSVKSKRCGCAYDGPVQVLTCARHNVAAKNLDRAQVLLNQAEIRVHHLEAALKLAEGRVVKAFSDMSFDEQIAWACGHVISSIGRGDLRGGMSLVLMAARQEAFHRGRESMKPEARKRTERGA